MERYLPLRLRLLFTPEAAQPPSGYTRWEVHLETVGESAWLVVTASLSCDACRAGAWAPSAQEASVLVKCRSAPLRNSAEESMRAQMRWSRFQAYWELTRLFREVRRERGGLPTLGEFYGFLQFPASFDWRRPSLEERVQMRRWAVGLDDARLDRKLYDRVRWLAAGAPRRRVCAERPCATASSASVGRQSESRKWSAAQATSSS